MILALHVRHKQQVNLQHCTTAYSANLTTDIICTTTINTCIAQLQLLKNCMQKCTIMSTTVYKRNNRTWKRRLAYSSAMHLFLCATAKASTTASTDNAIARSRSIANTARWHNLLSDIEFRTHVFICRIAEKVRSQEAVRTGSDTAHWASCPSLASIHVAWMQFKCTFLRCIDYVDISWRSAARGR